MDASSDVTVELRGGALRLEDAKRAVELELEQVQRQRKAELAELQGAQQHASRTEGDLHLIRDLQSKLESANHGRREAEEERDDLAQELGRVRGRGPSLHASSSSSAPILPRRDPTVRIEPMEARQIDAVGGRLDGRIPPSESERTLPPAAAGPRTAGQKNELEAFLMRPIDEFLPRIERRQTHTVAFNELPGRADPDSAPPLRVDAEPLAPPGSRWSQLPVRQSGLGDPVDPGDDGPATARRVAELQARAQQLDRELNALGPRDSERRLPSDDVDDVDDDWRHYHDGRGSDDDAA